MTNADFEIVTTTAGAVSIRDRATGETMHNPVGPWAEANALYVEQSDLAKRLGEDGPRELVIFDVGLGAAANALAALHCARGRAGRRPLKIVSFERELRLLEFALAKAHAFAHFAGYEGAVRALLDHGRWAGDGITWELRHGDFTELIAREEARADLIYFDPYSPKKNVEMWTVETFAGLRHACAPEGATLFTYSRATPVRVAMLMAGFYVGQGRASGLKDETTQASTDLARLERPLGEAWLRRWRASHAANACGAPEEYLDVVRRRLPELSQFTSRGVIPT